MKKSTPSQYIAQWIAPSFLLKLAGQKYYERGEGYYEDGCVLSTEIYGDFIDATVDGTETYKVKFWLENGEFEHECSCPLGDDGEFCKHCVAVGLTVMEQTQARDNSKQTEMTLEDVKNYLLGRDKDFLVELVMRQTILDSALRAKLFFSAANHECSSEERLKNLYQWIDQTIRLGKKQFLEYDQVHFYSQKVQAIVPHIEDLLSQGYAKEVALLTGYALDVLDQAMDHIEQADRCLDETVEALESLRDKTQPHIN